jgi:hypothetical protein
VDLTNKRVGIVGVNARYFVCLHELSRYLSEDEKKNTTLTKCLLNTWCSLIARSKLYPRWRTAKSRSSMYTVATQDMSPHNSTTATLTPGSFSFARSPSFTPSTLRCGTTHLTVHFWSTSALPGTPPSTALSST